MSVDRSFSAATNKFAFAQAFAGPEARRHTTRERHLGRSLRRATPRARHRRAA